jgi:hypothetical protein
MRKFDIWAAKAHEGQCCNCNVEGLVFSYDRNNNSSRFVTDGPKMELCYVCASIIGANAAEYPEQHPYHDKVVLPILGAISLLLYEIRKPKKPAKPRVKKDPLLMAPRAPAKRK